MTSLTLSKGNNLSLTKADPGLKRALVGLGWDPRTTSGEAFDLDASAILLGADGKVRSQDDFIFYNQLASKDQSVVHQGDNRTGEGDGDDEQIVVDLSGIPTSVQTLVFTVTSFGGQKFTEVTSAFARLIDANGAELVRFDLTDSKPTTGVIMCSMSRDGTSWLMTALGEFADGKTVRAMVKPARALL